MTTRRHRSSSSRSRRAYRLVPGGEGGNALGGQRRRRRSHRRLKRTLLAAGLGFLLFGSAAGILIWLALGGEASPPPTVRSEETGSAPPPAAIAPPASSGPRLASCPNGGQGRLSPPLAAACGDNRLLKAQLLGQPGMADTPDPRPEFAGRTALHHAAQLGDSQMVAALLAAGANPNQADAEGNTPLHLVTTNPLLPHPEFVARRLVDGGASPEARNSRGRTPIQELEAEHHRVLAHQNLAKVLYQAERAALLSQWLTPSVPAGERPLSLPEPSPPAESVVVETNEGRVRIPVDQPAAGTTQ